jgi:hypothetical protein
MTRKERPDGKEIVKSLSQEIRGDMFFSHCKLCSHGAFDLKRKKKTTAKTEKDPHSSLI